MDGKWRGAGWVAMFVAVLYAMSVYNSIFEKRPAFIYDPASDHLFEIILMQDFSSCDKWVLAIPFQHCFFGEVTGVIYRGKFHEKLKDIEADRNLAQKDFKAWVEKEHQETNSFFSTVANNDLELWDIVYRSTDSVRVAEVLPQKLSAFSDMKTDGVSDAFPVDIVLVRSTLKNKRADVETVRNAVFIRGKAAYQVQELGL